MKIRKDLNSGNTIMVDFKNYRIAYWKRIYWWDHFTSPGKGLSFVCLKNAWFRIHWVSGVGFYTGLKRDIRLFSIRHTGASAHPFKTWKLNLWRFMLWGTTPKPLAMYLTRREHKKYSYRKEE